MLDKSIRRMVAVIVIWLDHLYERKVLWQRFNTCILWRQRQLILWTHQASSQLAHEEAAGRIAATSGPSSLGSEHGFRATF